MATGMIVERTWWDGDQVRFATNEENTLEWKPGHSFHWDVGAMEAPVATPMYVFEPRPVERIAADLAQATTESTRAALAAERHLCERPHVVYIAFHGTLPKVGMTSEERFETRLIEQGADAGFVVGTTQERAAARTMEQTVAFRYGLPEWRTHREILPQWTRPVDRDRIERRAKDLANRLAGTHEPGDLQFFEHPLPVLPSRPHKEHVEGVHKGTIIGAKGNFLVYQSTPDMNRLDVGMDRIVAMKRTDLEGRRIQVLDATQD